MVLSATIYSTTATKKIRSNVGLPDKNQSAEKTELTPLTSKKKENYFDRTRKNEVFLVDQEEDPSPWTQIMRNVVEARKAKREGKVIRPKETNNNEEIKSDTRSDRSDKKAVSTGSGKISAYSPVHPVLPPRILSAALKTIGQMETDPEAKAFSLVDLSIVVDQFRLWKECFPSVKPYYAVKCNNDNRVLRQLSQLGCGFDCASMGELRRVVDIDAKADIIFAHPIKSRAAIRYAVENGINRMTFDSFEELEKMMALDRNIQPIMRIIVTGFNSMVDLNEKYGAGEERCQMILKKAADAQYPVCGISFHMGSGVDDFSPMTDTLRFARRIYDIGRKLNHPMRLLDIGGGILPGSPQAMKEFGKFVEEGLETTFGGEGLTYVAEPGRYMTTTCQYAVVRILQVVPKLDGQEQKANVFVNDGVYGTFNYVLLEKRDGYGLPINARPGLMKVDIWGQTCCSFDLLEKNRSISTLKEGDWLIYPNNGSYSTVLATDFNGFEVPRKIYVDDIEKE